VKIRKTRKEAKTMAKKFITLMSVFFMLVAGFFSLLVVTTTPVATATDFDQPGFALIAAPKFGEVSHANEALKIRDYLIGKGWDDARIIFLGKWTNKDFVDGTATKANIRDGIDEIALMATDDDIVFIAILDHAQAENDGIYFRTGDITDETYVKDTEFAGWIDDIPHFRHLVIYVASPYSGNFVEPLEGDYRIVLSDCAVDQVYKAGENTFYKALTKIDADTDDDGMISVEEAYDWMEEKKKKLDPLLSDFDESEDAFLY